MFKDIYGGLFSTSTDLEIETLGEGLIVGETLFSAVFLTAKCFLRSKPSFRSTRPLPVEDNDVAADSSTCSRYLGFLGVSFRDLALVLAFRTALLPWIRFLKVPAKTR